MVHVVRDSVSPSAGNPPRRRLLVVDDAPNIIDVFKMMFDPRRFELQWAPDMAAARRFLERGQPDLVVVDVVLPDGSGLDLCREVKASRPDLPVLVITGGARERLAYDARAAGADAFLVKPFAIDHAEATARRILSDSAPPARWS